jgi:hypothetical protein
MPATARKSKPRRKPSHRRAIAARPTTRQPDVTIQGHGSIALIVAETDAGHAWCDVNLADPETIRFGGGIACEPQYVDDIAEGMRNDGLNVEGA